MDPQNQFFKWLKLRCQSVLISADISQQRWSPRGHILKSLALKPQVLSLEALGPRKLLGPQLEDSTIF